MHKIQEEKELCFHPGIVFKHRKRPMCFCKTTMYHISLLLGTYFRSLCFFFWVFLLLDIVAAGGCIGFSILYFQHTYPNTTCEVYYFVFFVAKNPIAAHHTIRL